jgi:hypothetical protein
MMQIFIDVSCFYNSAIGLKSYLIVRAKLPLSLIYESCH